MSSLGSLQAQNSQVQRSTSGINRAHCQKAYIVVTPQQYDGEFYILLTVLHVMILGK